MTKEYYVKAILNHAYSFRLTGNLQYTICNWCGSRTENDLRKAPANEVAIHEPECPWLAATKEKINNGPTKE